MAINNNTAKIQELLAKINALPPVKKKEMKEKLEGAGLPTAFKNVTDVAVLEKAIKNKILEKHVEIAISNDVYEEIRKNSANCIERMLKVSK